MALNLAVIRMNKANSLFYQDKYVEAEREYARAIDELREGSTGEDADTNRRVGQATMLRAQALAKLRDPDKARHYLREGIELFTSHEDLRMSYDIAKDRIQFHSKAAEVYGLLGDARDMLQHADAALDYLHKIVRMQVAEDFWESLLGHWQRLPGRKVKGEIAVRRAGFARRAVIAAEAAKGRLLYRQLSGDAETTNDDALDDARQRDALERVRSWCRVPGKTRKVISLYADLEGLAVFVVGGNGRIFARWESEFPYLRWLAQRMDIWDEALLRQDRCGFPVVAQGVLGELGSALWRADRSLVSGGDELVLLPHKALRNLPLQHAVLPTNARLSDLFERVFVYPTLWDFAERLNDGPGAPSTGAISGCVDPDGNLPFAQLEGWLSCDRARLSAGRSVDLAEIKRQSDAADVLLLSCHGRFDGTNPWHSELQVGKERLNVMRFVDETDLPDIVVLGACEAGLYRRSASDEPVSFATIMLRRGVKAVLAPLWSVDDFSSALFITEFFGELRRGSDLVQSVAAATRVLRELTASQAIERLNCWGEAIAGQAARHAVDVDAIAEQIAATRVWLNSLSSEDRPWSLLDWGAFQLVGGYAEPG